MVFNSYQYAVFLPIVLGLYWVIKGHRRQNLLLLGASYIFYGAWDIRFLALMWLTTLVDFAVGRRLERLDDDRARRRTLVISLVVNLGVLATFKYFGFFADSLVALADGVGLHLSEPTLTVLLPIGISFYTFHGISYTVDVYRREIRAEHHLPTFAVFVAYFPQLVAGPIGRAQVQLPQFSRDRAAPDADRVRSALSLILLGLVKKVVIADGLAPLVTQVFSASSTAPAPTLVLGAYGFALQIYGDFSGYSDIARGSSRLFGIELLENFRQPYLSSDVAEFWRRWHISLSTWLRDYLYIPLGGNRRGARRTSVNLMITMALGGLWHGASWTFVAWGVLHGAFLVVHHARPARAGVRLSRGRRLLSVLVTFHLVVAAWVFFRAEDLADALRYLGGIATLRGGPIYWSLAAQLAISASLALAVDLLQRRSGREDFASRWVVPARGALAGAAAFAIVVFSGGPGAPFIYFQF